MAMMEHQIQLVVAAQNGDVKSFEQLYAIYHEKVYGFARMILKNERDAEDVLQETFIAAWQKLNTLDSPPTFSVWIQIIAKNLCNMQLRRKNMVILLDAEQDIENFDTQESAEMLPAVYAERADLRERLGRIIDGLSEVQRQTVTLYYFNELSVDEISQVMECSPGTVKSRLFLARNTVKTEIEEQERKTGQKFYGIAGIPLLPFGKLIQSHMESLSINQSAASASLSAITNSIADSNGAGAVADGVAANGIVADGATAKSAGLMITVATAKKMSLTAKIILSISSLVAVGFVAVLAVMMVTGGGKNNPSSSDDPALEISSGTISEPGDSSIPAESSQTPISSETSEPSSMSSSAVSSQTPISSETSDPGDSSIPAESSQTTLPGSSSSGDTVYNNNNLSTAVADIPQKEALNEIYILLEGYWITESDPFVGFFKNANGDHEIEYGLFHTSFGARGKIIDGRATGTNEATLIVYIPAVPETEMDAPQPERTEKIRIDISGLNQSGDTTIKVKIENPDISGWHTYKPSGMNMDFILVQDGDDSLIRSTSGDSNEKIASSYDRK